MPQVAQGGTKLRFQEFVIDLQAGRLLRDGEPIRLQAQPFEVLTFLVQNAGEVVTREDLRSHIWPSDTFVDFDNSLNTAVNKIREALGDSASAPRFIETLPRRGYRFIAVVQPAHNGKGPTTPAAAVDGKGTKTRRLLWGWGILGSVIAAVVLTAAISMARHSSRLTEPDIVLLADFENRTGESVFDGTLKQALAVQLRQSPFLSLIPEQQIRQTLAYMGKRGDVEVTSATAEEVCQRLGATAVVAGTLSKLTTHYVIGLDAVNCQSGKELAQESIEVENRDHVIAGLGEAASRMRRDLGEALPSIQRYNVPVLQATTTSLDALKAYSLGVTEYEALNPAGALALFKQAIVLDPQFALAYAREAMAYGELGEYELGRASLEKAFALRDRVSQQEKLSIETLYYEQLGDVEHLFETNRLWAALYPRDRFPHTNLALRYNIIGEFEKAEEESDAAVRVAPYSAFGYVDLATAHFGLGQWQAARNDLQPVIARGEGDYVSYCFLYVAAIAQGDMAAADAYYQEAQKKLAAGDMARLQFTRAELEFFQGKVKEGRETAEQSEQIAWENGLKENSGAMAGLEALWESQSGDANRARRLALHALSESRGIDVSVNSAIALATVGETERAKKLADELQREHPQDTIVNTVSVPLILSNVELREGHAERAIALLRVAEPYENGFGFFYYPGFMAAYTRGSSYLKLHDGVRAANEFQRILDHRGIDPVSPIYAAAELRLAEAKALIHK